MMLISFLCLVGAYSAVPPPASIQKGPAAPAANKNKGKDSSESSDDSSDEEEEKKIAGKRLPPFLSRTVTVFEGMSNSFATFTAKPAPVKAAAAKPAAKKQESSSESSGNI